MSRLSAQLIRTEEAAKRAMLRSDGSAQGGAAARLLNLERQLMRVTADKLEAEGMHSSCSLTLTHCVRLP